MVRASFLWERSADLLESEVCFISGSPRVFVAFSCSFSREERRERWGECGLVIRDLEEPRALCAQREDVLSRTLRTLCAMGAEENLHLGSLGKSGELGKIWGVGENLESWGKSGELGEIWGVGENLES